MPKYLKNKRRRRHRFTGFKNTETIEMKPFDTATNAVAEHSAELTQAGKLMSVAGGGDTVSALANAGVEKKFSYISTAGGAFLEWMEGKELPGVVVLKK